MNYYVTFYKYRFKDHLSGQFLHTHESQTPITLDEIETIIENLLHQTGTTFDKVVVYDSRTVPYEEYKLIKAGVGVALDEHVKKVKSL